MRTNKQTELAENSELNNYETTMNDEKVKLGTLTYVTKRNGDKTAFIMTDSLVGTDKTFDNK